MIVIARTRDDHRQSDEHWNRFKGNVGKTSERDWYFVCNAVILSTMFTHVGGSGGVVNSLDFCPAWLKSLGWFYFRCVLSSQWKAVTVNLRILHCQL